MLPVAKAISLKRKISFRREIAKKADSTIENTPWVCRDYPSYTTEPPPKQILIKLPTPKQADRKHDIFKTF